MPIAIQCPHCQRSFKLKDELAGKKVNCTGCRKAFPVPMAVPVATKAPAPALDPEALALAALADAPAPKAETPVAEAETATISIKCPHCDFQNTYEARMAGKNAQCKNEECGKIIKVPLLQKQEAKDWRQAGKALPTMARRDTDQIEGAWGNAEKVAVSREALKEAQAIGGPVEADEPASRWKRRIKIIAVATVLFAVIGLGTRWGLRRWSAGKTEHAMEMALDYTELSKAKKEKLPKDKTALICLLAARHDLHAGKAKESWEHLMAARGRLDATTLERQAALIEVAALLADLPGSAAEVEQGKRLDWDKGKIHTEISATLQRLVAVPGEDGRDLRAQTFRILTRKMVARDYLDKAILLSNSGDEAERGLIWSVVGLELVALGKREQAEELANKAMLGGGGGSPELIALWLALGSPDVPEKEKAAWDKARAIAPPPGKETPTTPLNRLGYAEGYARLGKREVARQIAWDRGKPEERLRAGTAVAAAVADSNPSDSATDLNECIKLVENEFKDRNAPPWLLFRLVQVSAKAGHPDLAKRFAVAIGDPGLRAWAQCEALQARLKTPEFQKQKADVDLLLDIGDADKFGHVLAWSALAQHNARVAGSASALRDVTRIWDKESLRPFGFAGIALADVPNGRDQDLGQRISPPVRIRRHRAGGRTERQVMAAHEAVG